MKIVNLKVDLLKEYENNPRFNDEAVEKVVDSIKEFGFKVPIVIDKNNVIVSGHTRLKAAKQLNLKTVPCIVADDLTPEQVKAFRLVDNKVSEYSTWNVEKLEQELMELKVLDFDIESFDFETENIDLSDIDADKIKDKLDKENSLGEIKEDNFDVEEALEEIKKPIVKKGQIWKLGNHYLMCGDATKKEDVEKLMSVGENPSLNLADLLITDPPYNVNYEGKTKTAMTIQNDKMLDSDFRDFLKDSLSAADKVMKRGAVFYIWHADSEGYNFRGACHDIGWKVRQCLIWSKNSMVLGRQDYHWKHEPCLYGWTNGASHNWYSDRSQTTVMNFDKPSRSEEHPTMKPVELFAYQIKNSTKENDIVLDLFAGSGTSLIASEQLNRKCYAMELDEKYADVIIKRWETLTGKKAERLE